MKKNIKYITYFFVFLVAFLIQTTMLKHIAILGYSPNVLLCLVVVTSFLFKEKIGLVYGLVFGVLLDLITGISVGPSAIAFALIYVFVIIMKSIFNHERLLPELILAAVSTPLYSLVIWLFAKIAGSPIVIMEVVMSLPVLLIYNGVIIVLLHLVLVRSIIKHKKDETFSGKYELHNGLKL